MYPRCFLGMENIAVSKRNKILVPMDVILWQGIETITFSEINPKTKKKKGNTKISKLFQILTKATYSKGINVNL